MKTKPEFLFKVGGSLLGWPGLIPALEAQIKSVRPPVLVLFGGGVMVDLLRDWDTKYHFGEKSSHWLAIDTLDLIARSMVAAMPGWKLWAESYAPIDTGAYVVAPAAFCKWDACQNPENCLPESWMATSDSIALRMATVWGIESLTLFKSINSGFQVGEAVTKAWDGLVDQVFGGLVEKPGAPRNIRIVGLLPG